MRRSTPPSTPRVPRGQGRASLLALGCLLATLAAGLGSCRAPAGDMAPPVAVTVIVDFGTPSRPVLTEQMLVPAGTSPIEALAEVAEVDQRFVSRTAGDVWSIEGVATNVEEGRYWQWRLNGRYVRKAPDRYDLRNGDQVTWSYRTGEPPQYER